MSKKPPTAISVNTKLEDNRRKLRLVEELRARMRHMNERLAHLDVHSAQTPDEQAAFWDSYIADAEGVIRSVHSIVQLQGGSGKERMLRYMIAHVGEPVEGTTLAAISGVLDWARRIRELSDQFDYAIATSKTDSSLRPGQYCLRSGTPQKSKSTTHAKI